jgi:hypothetical protein
MTNTVKPILYIDMDGVIADFDSATARLAPEQRAAFAGTSRMSRDCSR